MVNIVGQQTILAALENYTIDNVPSTLLFVGEKGSGKHLIVKHLSEQLNCELVEITQDTTTEDINDFMWNPVTTMYLLDLDNIPQKQQNSFLKFIEEPSETVKIALITSNDITVLPTILNRCIIYRLESYTPEQLKEICNLHSKELDDFARDIYTTPGQIISADLNQTQVLRATCECLIEQIEQSDYSRVLNFSTKLNYKEDYSKCDCVDFFKILKKVSEMLIIRSVSQNKSINKNYTIAYDIASEFLSTLVQAPTSAKENLTIYFLTKLWRSTRYGHSNT